MLLTFEALLNFLVAFSAALIAFSNFS